MLYTAQLGLNHPIAIRYPRGRGITIDWKQPFSKIEIGKGEQLKEGKEVAVLSIGTISKNVTEALNSIENPETFSHYDMRFVKPLDAALLHSILKKHNTIITIEDGTVSGGFGSAILEFAAKHNYKSNFITKGIKDKFIEHGTTEELQKINEIDSESLKILFESIKKAD